MTDLEMLPFEEAEAIVIASDRAAKGGMNYYVGRRGSRHRVFDGRAWLWGDGTVGWKILWGVWHDGTLIANPGTPRRVGAQTANDGPFKPPDAAAGRPLPGAAVVPARASVPHPPDGLPLRAMPTAGRRRGAPSRSGSGRSRSR